MATVTFAIGATSITINAPKYPERPGASYPMILGRTMGGGMKVADMGDGTSHSDMVLRFLGLTRTQYVALRDFIANTAEHGKNAFTYTDPFSVAHTDMHYIGGIPEAQSSRGDRWAVDLSIFKDMAA